MDGVNVSRVGTDEIHTFCGRSIRFYWLHGQLGSFYFKRSISGILSLIRIRCSGNSTFEDIDLLNVAGEAVEAFLSFQFSSV